MRTLVLKSLAQFLPTLLIISMIAFFLSKLAPGDPLERILPQDQDLPGSAKERAYYDKKYTQAAIARGLDLPWFYFSLSTQSTPDTLHRIVLPRKKLIAKKLSQQGSHWQAIETYLHHLTALENTFYQLPKSWLPQWQIDFRHSLSKLWLSYEYEAIGFHLNTLHSLLETSGSTTSHPSLTPLVADMQALNASFQALLASDNKAKNYLPALRWHGFDNQYHLWIKSFFLGKWQKSYSDNRSVGIKLREAAQWTLILNIIAIILSFGIAIPLGIFLATQKDTLTDKRLSFLLFFLYAIPSFWMAMLLLAFFTTPQYGMNWLASAGLGRIPEGASYLTIFLIRAKHLILPVFCLSYGTIAFITRQVRGSMIDVLRQEYIKTARAKGLSQKKILWKHAFRNAVFPLITLVALVFPSLLAGSLVIEVIFNIPGLGRLMYASILSYDWPVVFTLLFGVGILTMLGNLLADLLYRWADPRI